MSHRRGIRLCARQIAVEALGLDTKTIESRRSLLFGDIRKIMDTMPGWKRLDVKKRCGEYGVQRCWEYEGDEPIVEDEGLIDYSPIFVECGEPNDDDALF